MSDEKNEINLYESPQAVAAVTDAAILSGALTETMIAHLKQAAPWLRFLGIMGFIGAGFMALIGIIGAIAMGVVGNEVLETLSEVVSPVLTLLSGGFFGVIYIGLGVVYFFPARFTYQFGNKIRTYLHSNNPADLEDALKNNKSLWKFNGILTIVWLAAVPVFIVIAVVAAVAIAVAA